MPTSDDNTKSNALSGHHARVALYETLGVPPSAARRAENGLQDPHLEGADDDRAGAADMAPLDIAGIAELLAALETDPEGVLDRAGRALDRRPSEAEFRAGLLKLRALLANPEKGLSLVEADRGLESAEDVLPPDFTFDGYDPSAIPIDPSSHKFEEGGDWLGWLVNAGRWALGPPAGRPEDFPWHDAPTHRSGFVYPLRGQGEAPLDVVLFADFATGLYHSRYIAKQIIDRRPPYAIHLGDVYYAGRREEVNEYFQRPLWPSLAHTRLFSLASNHEMFSRFGPYFDAMRARREAFGAMQEQEGSYFCLRGKTAQIIGIDTDYFADGRCSDPTLLEWLRAHLLEGRRTGLTNIVLSPDEPYEYGSMDRTALLEHDLRGVAIEDRLVDLWFWGNTHYCALFDRTDELPFVASCIGHGGFPYARVRPGKVSPAPVRFLETKARFPEWTGVRQDRGNNGYCVMTLGESGDVRLRYVDWMSRDRCVAELVRDGEGKLRLTGAAPVA
jgi:hypothetical protein